MIIEKIAPTCTVATPTIVSRSQRKRFTPVGRHLSIKNIPMHSTNVGHCTSPVNSMQLIIADLRRRRHSINGGISTVTRIYIRPATQWQSGTPFKELVDTIIKVSCVRPSGQISNVDFTTINSPTRDRLGARNNGFVGAVCGVRTKADWLPRCDSPAAFARRRACRA